MRYEWIDEFLLEKKGVTRDLQKEWNWNSIKPDGEVPDELLKDLLDKSYHLVLKGFSKKRQAELLGERSDD